jgi:hypothetical protein
MNETFQPAIEDVRREKEDALANIKNKYKNILWECIDNTSKLGEDLDLRREMFAKLEQEVLDMASDHPIVDSYVDKKLNEGEPLEVLRDYFKQRIEELTQ